MIWNIFLLYCFTMQWINNFFVLFGYIELIKPADYFNFIFEVFFGNFTFPFGNPCASNCLGTK